MAVTLGGLLLLGASVGLNITMAHRDGMAVVAVIPLVLIAVGGLLAARRAGNAVGWLLLASGLLWAGLHATEAYARYGLAHDPGSLPGAGAALWFATWLWLAAIFVLVFVLLLFPDGRLLSPRWRPILRAGQVGLVLALTAQATVRWGPGAYHYPFASHALNPLHVPALEPIRVVVAVGGGALLGIALLGSLTSIIVRFRRARGVERLQTKWVVFGVSSAFLLYALSGIAGAVYEQLAGRVVRLEEVPFSLLLASFPVTIALAVLRYRLYDIDRIVGRTVSYVVVTAVLVAIYAGGVVGFGAVARGVAGDPSNDVVVAASTLAVAAAFGPLRRRVQGIVDRRFNRARYDAARTVERFAQRLRDDLDVGSIAQEVRAVVPRTVQPTHLSIWLGSEKVRP
ncbi:MAG: hypothetical protein M3N57_12975 [Actinomycetota bacterium]|nr:hypothetical protein [Actinomycetota bacterium]